jgi:hypothetical protein
VLPPEGITGTIPLRGRKDDPALIDVDKSCGC